MHDEGVKVVIVGEGVNFMGLRGGVIWVESSCQDFARRYISSIVKF